MTPHHQMTHSPATDSTKATGGRPSVLTAAATIGSAPAGAGGMPEKARLAGLRALRTLLQGIAAALITAFSGDAAFEASWTRTFLFLLLSACVTSLASFLNNLATFLPEDPTQRSLS